MSWTTSSLGDLVQITSGFAFKSELFNNDGHGLPLVRIRDVVRGFSETFYDGPFQEQFRVSDGEILVGMDGEFNAAKWAGGPALLNQRVCRIDVTAPVLSSDYLFWFLPAALKAIEDRTAFATVKHLSAKDIRAIQIPVPPLDEQRRIAATLDQADALRRKRREAIALLTGLERAVFIEMFGPPEVNPNKLPLVDLGELIVEGPTNGLYKPSTDYGSGTPILRIGDFYDGQVTDLDRLRRLRATDKEKASYALRENDIVINRVNSLEYLGKSAIVPRLEEATVFESNMMKIRLESNNIDPRYCISFLQLPFVRRQILQSSKDAVNQSSINQSDVRSLVILLPSIEKQHAFVDRTQRIEAALSDQHAHAQHLDALFASLQHRAFQGRL